MSDEELFNLYLDAFCGLVCPFPRLEAMRSRPDLISDWDECRRLLETERDYRRKRAEARDRFLAEMKRRPHP